MASQPSDMIGKVRNYIMKWSTDVMEWEMGGPQANPIGPTAEQWLRLTTYTAELELLLSTQAKYDALLAASLNAEHSAARYPPSSLGDPQTMHTQEQILPADPKVGDTGQQSMSKSDVATGPTAGIPAQTPVATGLTAGIPAQIPVAMGINADIPAQTPVVVGLTADTPTTTLPRRSAVDATTTCLAHVRTYVRDDHAKASISGQIAAGTPGVPSTVRKSLQNMIKNNTRRKNGDMQESLRHPVAQAPGSSTPDVSQTTIPQHSTYVDPNTQVSIPVISSKMRVALPRTPLPSTKPVLKGPKPVEPHVPTLPMSYKEVSMAPRPTLPPPPPQTGPKEAQATSLELCNHVDDVECSCAMPWSRWGTREEYIQTRTVPWQWYTKDWRRDLCLCYYIFEKGFCEKKKKCPARHWKLEANERLWMDRKFLKAYDNTIGWNKVSPLEDQSYRAAGGPPRQLRNTSWCLGYGKIEVKLPEEYQQAYEANVNKGLKGDIRRGQRKSRDVGIPENRGRQAVPALGRGAGGDPPEPRGGAGGGRKDGDSSHKNRYGKSRDMASRKPTPLADFLKKPDMSKQGHLFQENGDLVILPK
jgi:hypothetical protein